MGYFTERKSLLNINPSQHHAQQSTLFSFANEEAKKYGLKMQSKFVNSRVHDHIDPIDDPRITFNGEKDSGVIGFREAKRPPKLRKQNDGRDSLTNVKNSSDTSPKTIKLKNKTFYLIAS